MYTRLLLNKANTFAPLRYIRGICSHRHAPPPRQILVRHAIEPALPPRDEQRLAERVIHVTMLVLWARDATSARAGSQQQVRAGLTLDSATATAGDCDRDCDCS